MNTNSVTWWLGWVAVGIATGLFVSWSITGAVFGWPLPLMIVLFVAGGAFQSRLRRR